MLAKNSAMFLETTSRAHENFEEPDNDPEGRGGEKR